MMFFLPSCVILARQQCGDMIFMKHLEDSHLIRVNPTCLLPKRHLTHHCQKRKLCKHRPFLWDPDPIYTYLPFYLMVARLLIVSPLWLSLIAILNCQKYQHVTKVISSSSETNHYLSLSFSLSSSLSCLLILPQNRPVSSWFHQTSNTGMQISGVEGSCAGERFLWFWSPLRRRESGFAPQRR